MEEFVFWDARANARHDDGWMGVQQEQGKSEIYLLEEAEKKTRRRNIIYTRKQAERPAGQSSQVKLQGSGTTTNGSADNLFTYVL